ncbi:MAG: hypothetical protein ABR505_02000 [Actinomycetota bacterium]
MSSADLVLVAITSALVATVALLLVAGISRVTGRREREGDS